MKLSPAMIEAMNKQINLELSSAYVYLGMAAWCDNAHFRGSARWFRAQSKEEVEHAMKLYRYLAEYDAPVTMAAIPAPKAEYGSLLETFEGALAHERMVSASIEKLYELAMSEKAHALAVQLQWFLTEQVEEEMVARKAVGSLKVVGDDMVAKMEVDRYFGSRGE
ncbi:ferritin [candidate division BRC1 bacterium HGW-BRC1-1]|jgi:ferritin|nr:MAG: ferritin [candidate division BRC1 bacterium HGW-BRC1-1]